MMMKRLIIKILLKFLHWLGWSPLHIPCDFPTFTINQTNLERIELRFENEIKCPPHIFDEYILRVKKEIPYEMSKKLVDVIEKNMEIHIQYKGDPYCPYPVIRSRMEIYIKN